MSLNVWRRFHRGAWVLLGFVALFAGLVAEAPSSSATGSVGAPSTAGIHSYLALGDSVSFGYREPKTSPPPDYSQPTSFVGYPEDVGSRLGVRVANAACPGETSVSFIEANVASNGCENTPRGGPGYRTAFPLHVNYAGTQLQYALQYLEAHPNTTLVTLMIGSNDTLLCRETTPDRCTSELPGVLRGITSDVADILDALRNQANYHGTIVLVNYYSLNYASRAENIASMTVNHAMDRDTQQFGVRIADGYGAFKAAAASSGGDTCTAGLLTRLTSGGCGIHPSPAGQAVLARAVEATVPNR